MRSARGLKPRVRAEASNNARESSPGSPALRVGEPPLSICDNYKINSDVPRVAAWPPAGPPGSETPSAPSPEGCTGHPCGLVRRPGSGSSPVSTTSSARSRS
ncbi:hypothetical protein GCM10009834_42590 [Streptomonospora arabica]